MPQVWIPTLKRRLMLRALDFFARPSGWRSIAATGVEQVRRILVVEPKNIGDVVLTIPFLTQLRARFPTAGLTLLAAPHAKAVLHGTGLVDDYIETRLDWTEKSTRYNPFAYDWAELWRLKREMSARHFDLAFNCCMHIRERVVMGLSGARRRIAYAFGEGDALLTDPIAVDNPQRHKVDDWLGLLDPFGGATTLEAPHLHIDESERAWANGYLSSRGVPTDVPVIGIHPGASLVEKRWPLEGFRQVAIATTAQSGVKVLAFAEPSGYGAELFDIPGVVGAQVTLREMMALIEQSSLLVCNDSGPMHIAGALGVPTVAMFGAGIEQWFAPLGHGHEILRPDHDEKGTDPASSVGAIRAPMGIKSAKVLEAVGRAVHRLRARGTFSRG
jgi:ADP-heptose:LPS heptosyltransferase